MTSGVQIPDDFGVVVEAAVKHALSQRASVAQPVEQVVCAVEI